MDWEGWVSQMGRGGRSKEDEGVFGVAMEWEGNKEAEVEGEIQKEGEDEIQKEGEGDIQEGECSGMGKGMHGMGKGMYGMGKGMRGKGMGAVGFGCKKQPKKIEH